MSQEVNPSDYDIDDGTMGVSETEAEERDDDDMIGSEEDNTVMLDDEDDDLEGAYLDPESDDPASGAEGDDSEEKGGSEDQEGRDASEIITDDTDFEPDLVKRALAVGLKEDTLKALGDDAMSVVERLETASGTSAKEPQRDEQGRFKSADETSGDDENPISKLNLDEYDENIVKAFQFMQNRVDQLLEQSRAAEQDRVLNDLDSFVDGLGSDWNDVFGSGPSRSLNSKSLAAKNRLALLEEMDAIADGYARRGKQVPSEKDLRDKALRSAFGKQFDKKSQRRLSVESQKQRQTRVTRPPASKRTVAETGERKAVQTVQSILRNGIL